MLINENNTYNKYIRLASKIVLTKRLPYEWNELDYEDDIKPFIKEHRSAIFKKEVDEDGLWLIIIRIAMEMENAARL
jgi:hypothetical protein